ncbi:hypothetical protein DPMN_134960 [Dreissena polymorpha]|uniref:Uncharacterized protein n=1 Tax=Dreissena polymorpha TaxID=45954 RepID=A0A9D4G0N1_DREPO|nr:hypothetical protein DPMN_134960 [Dreissena polymorpha]
MFQGPALSTALVNAGLTTFDKLKETNPREIELIVNRHPPFGNQIRESIAKLPKYELSIQQVARYCSSSAEIVITVELTNQDLLRDLGCNTNHMCTLVVGDEDNMTVYKQRIMDALLMKEKSWSKRLEVRRAVKGAELFIHYISQEWVGLDIECTYTPHYLGEQTMSNHMETLSDRLEDMGDLVPCHHQCRNKRTCNHPCCKHGVPSKRHASNNSQKGILAKARPTSSNAVTSHVQNLEKWVEKMPPTPRLANRIRPNYNNGMDHPDLSRFAYTPAKITGDKLGRNNNSGCTPESGQHFSNHFNQAPTTSNVNLVKRKTDWADLDMYIKYRQNQSFNDNEINNNISDEDSLPDIDGANQDMTYTGLDTGQDKWTDDFEQETDYGYRYVHDVTDSEIPAEWDERLNTHMQQISTIAKRKKASSVARRPKKLHTDLDQPQNNLPTCGQPLYVATPLYGSTNASKATSGPKSPKMVESHPSMTRQHDPVCGYKANLHGDDQVDNPHDTSLYDIEDFSTDESFEDCCPSDSSNTAHESNVSNTGLAPSRFVYQYSGPNLTGNNVKVPSRNTANLPADCNDNRRSSSFQNGLKHQSSIHPNQSKPTGSILKRTPFHNHTDSTLKENSGPKINTMVFENDDSCDEMFHDGIAGSRQSASKWTNFFSSQSSTASDRMNLEYPAMHGHNQLVMERHGGSRKQESEDNKETPKGSVTDKSTATCSSHIGTKRHNYGQVLAWVSNPANHPGASRSAPSENKSDTRGCAGNSDSTTSAKHIAERPKSQNLNLLFTKNPVKQTGAFSNIFEGLF